MNTSTKDGSPAYLPADWIRPLARFGYASRSVVYLIIGFFAVLSGLGQQGNKDTKGALRVVLEQPFGQVLVTLLIIGLLGYVVWRLIQSLMDTDGHGWSPKGIAVRGGLLASAFTYGVLTVYALSLIGFSSIATGDSSPGLADRIASLVGSGPVVAAMSVIFAGVAIAHWYKAFTRGYASHFDKADAHMSIVHPVAMLGLFARGMVFAIIAMLLVYRLTTQSSGNTDPPGLIHALRFVQDLPAGGVLLTTLGVGLVLFSAYSAFEALWRNINVEDAAIDDQLPE